AGALLRGRRRPRGSGVPEARTQAGIILRFARREVLMSFALVFPGQGSQSVGMLAALAAADGTVRSTFEEASGVLGYDLWKLVSEGPEADLNATARTQPALLAAGVATWRCWRARGGAEPAHLSGHSLGEFTALVCAESIEFRAAVGLVRYRGEVM